jgi:hypothetical protein
MYSQWIFFSHSVGGLSLVIDMDLVSVFCRQLSNFPSNVCWRGWLFYRMFLTSLSKIRWGWLCGFISGSSILFYQSAYLFLCQCVFYCYGSVI